jgi:streptogramin lyase
MGRCATALAALLVISVTSLARPHCAADGTERTIHLVAQRNVAGADAPARAAQYYPCGVAVAADGSIYIADWWNHVIRRIDPEGVVSTVAGNGDGGYSGDGGPAAEASLKFPHGVATGRDGIIYVADTGNHRVRKVDPAGIITTVAGNGEGGHSGDGGPAAEASLHRPHGVVLGAAGNLYIADTDNHRIRKVDPAGIITTVAGDGESRYLGDGGPAARASLHRPCGVAMGADGSLFIADRYNHCLRKVDPAGVMSTLAGTGEAGYSGDGGAAVEARLTYPHGVAVGADGIPYIADTANHRVRTVDPAGIITTVAGDGRPGFAGDGGPAEKSRLNWPFAVAVATDGSVYIADHDNRRIRKINPTGTIGTVAGDTRPE